MGKDTPFITEGDGKADVEISLIEAYGIKYEDYVEDNSILTKEIFEAHLNELLDLVNKVNHYVAYLILGVLILKTGTNLTEDLREKLIKAAAWENNRKDWKLEDTDEDREFLDLRKEILLDFQEKIRNHKPGVITDIF